MARAAVLALAVVASHSCTATTMRGKAPPTAGCAGTPVLVPGHNCSIGIFSPGTSVRGDAGCTEAGFTTFLIQLQQISFG